MYVMPERLYFSFTAVSCFNFRKVRLELVGLVALSQNVKTEPSFLRNPEQTFK